MFQLTGSTRHDLLTFVRLLTLSNAKIILIYSVICSISLGASFPYGEYRAGAEAPWAGRKTTTLYHNLLRYTCRNLLHFPAPFLLAIWWVISPIGILSTFQQTDIIVRDTALTHALHIPAHRYTYPFPSPPR